MDNFATIEVELKGINRRLDELMASVTKHIDDDHHIMFGDERNPGLMIIVDRLEQAHRQRKWVTTTAIAAFVSTLGELIWHFVKP